MVKSPRMSDPILATDNISKSFGVVRALSNVSIALFPGQVHGIVGENGAGKSTLMKILSGVERPDSGRIFMRGEPVDLRHPANAQRLGISMIHQELNLIDDLSVADNIFLGKEKTRAGFINGSSTRKSAEELLRSIHCDVSPAVKVRSLSIAQKQMVEIAKAVSTRASVLIMDEPTAVLSGRESAALFEFDPSASRRWRFDCLHFASASRGAQAVRSGDCAARWTGGGDDPGQ